MSTTPPRPPLVVHGSRGRGGWMGESRGSHHGRRLDLMERTHMSFSTPHSAVTRIGEVIYWPPSVEGAGTVIGAKVPAVPNEE